FFFFSSRRRHTISKRDWSSDVCSSDLLLEPPLPREKARRVTLQKGPNIASIPEMDELPDQMEVPVLLKMGDHISTDEILAGGSRVLPYRSNLPEISKFTFEI